MHKECYFKVCFTFNIFILNAMVQFHLFHCNLLGNWRWHLTLCSSMCFFPDYVRIFVVGSIVCHVFSVCSLGQFAVMKFLAYLKKEIHKIILS